MSLFEAILLGIVQGLTEFIPVSSSGHLVILEKFLSSETAAGLAFDVALHVGTLLALFIYFWKDIQAIFIGFFKGKTEARMAKLIGLATIPAVVSGLLLGGYAETVFRSLMVVGVSLIIVGVVMFFAENFYMRKKQHLSIEKISWKQALMIGLAQSLAVIPGVSRSGSTIVTGLFTGLSRQAALRFSFLMAIPVVAGASIKTFADKGAIDLVMKTPDVFLLGAFAACISGLLAIKFMLGYLNNRGLEVFGWYRIVLGCIVLAVALS